MRRILIEADGGSRGNPGPAGYGAVVRDAGTGEVLAEVAEAIGRATNNVAEYQGLIAGLSAATDLAPGATVEARMDSKLVVEQMSGRWRIKHPDMIPLAREARRLAAGFGAVRYTWVPRARNAHADRLANEAMDAAAKGVAWSRKTTDNVEVPEPEPEPPAAHGLPGWMSPPTPPTTTLLLRHGETPLSVQKRFAGVGDISLTDTGFAQARTAASALAGHGIDVIVSSPLKRTRQMAGEAAAVVGAEVRLEEGFREVDFGDWEGYTFGEVQQRWPQELTAWLADPAIAPPGGESLATAARRVRTARDKLLVRFRHKTVLVVSHVTPIKTLVRLALLAPPTALYRMHLDVASLSTIDWYDDGPAVLRLLNDTAHLREHA